MFTAIKEFLFGKPAQVEAPGKTVELNSVEDGAVKLPAQCGCGRSASGYCVGLHALTADEWSKHPDNKTVAVQPKLGKSADDRVEAPAPVKKAPAKKQQFEKKTVPPKPTATTKAPPKPRAPRKPTAK